MMSLNNLTGSLGAAFGAGLGGIVLLSAGYEYMGLSIGSIFIIAATIFYFFVIEPN